MQFKRFTTFHFNLHFFPIKAETSCGKKTTSLAHLTGRIAGGSVTTPNEYPWMVYLQIYSSKFSNFYYVCGGTLISNQWILSSANCVDGSVYIFNIIDFC